MNDSGTALIRKCQSGCQESFNQLYQRYHLMVLKVAREIMGNEHDAEDALQEIFMRIFTRISQFRYESSFSSWVRSIAVNACKDMLRSRNRRPTEPLENLEVEIIKSSIRQDEELVMRELLENLQEKIGHLRKEYQKLIILRYIDGLSYQKIAQLLDCTPSLVKSRLYQARKELKRICQNLYS
jgi:RNA polymerase sigma-70 factor (ECF subfamily)